VAKPQIGPWWMRPPSAWLFTQALDSGRYKRSGEDYCIKCRTVVTKLARSPRWRPIEGARVYV